MHLAGVSLVLAVASLVVIQAECPNGCSGRGSCSSKDMCQCYKNFQGNDCSERTCGFGYAHTDTPKGDLNMDGSVDTTSVLTNSQVYPYGTYEQYNPDAVANEGHFYMECSNQGLCNREFGDCVCFDGFEGSACQRASCPNACSNHGSCESISEFATTAGGTLFTKGLSSGDTQYDLWDAKVSYGCRCDPWFTGADCSQRLCKVGVDPMYYDTEQVTYETIALDNVVGAGASNYIRIRFWDYWGESFITDRIYGGTGGITAAKIEAAFEALPNGVISDLVECASWVASTDHSFLSAQYSTLDVLCQFKSNPGALRLPEIYEQVVSSNVEIGGTPLRGEDENLCNTLFTAAKISSVNSAGTITLSTTTSVATVPYLVKYNDQYAVVTGESVSGGILTLTLASPIVTADVTGLSADLYYSHTSLEGGIGMDNDADNAAGATELKINSHSYVAGNKIICESQIFNIVSVSTGSVFLDRPYFGTAIGRADSAETYCYEISSAARTTTYVSECAGRGICDRESGVCSCFKGYTNDNCDKQSILAF